MSLERVKGKEITTQEKAPSILKGLNYLECYIKVLDLSHMSDPIEKIPHNNESPLYAVTKNDAQVQETAKVVEMKTENRLDIDKQIKSLKDQLVQHNEAIDKMEVAHAYGITESSLADNIHENANLNPGEIRQEIDYYKGLKKKTSLRKKIARFFSL